MRTIFQLIERHGSTVAGVFLVQAGGGYNRNQNGWAWPRSAKQGQLGNRIDSKSGNAVQFAKQAIRVEIVGDWKRLNPQ